jgi:hypothetical protein
LEEVVVSKHSHRTPEVARVNAQKKIVEILRTVPYEKGFHFHTALGQFTGETATSLDDFERKLQLVPAESVVFHLLRRDFQEWIKDTLGDSELAERVDKIKNTLPDEEMRKETIAIVQTRLTQLKRELPHHLRHVHS